MGTPGVCLAVRNTIMDFTWLTFGAEVSRVVRNSWDDYQKFLTFGAEVSRVVRNFW